MAATQAVAKARAALATHLEEEGLLATNGEIVRPVPDHEVSAEVQAKVARLETTTFGRQFTLTEYLRSEGYRRVNGSFATPMTGTDDWWSTARDLQQAIAEAEAALKAEAESSRYYLRSRKLMQTGFRPLIELKTIELEANRRLLEHLAKKELIAFRSRIFRPATDDELYQTRTEGETRRQFQGVFGEADKLVRKGFGKRDELLEFLWKHDKSWRDLKFYVLADTSDPADAEYYEDTDGLLGVVHLAASKLREIEEEQALRIDDDLLIHQTEHRVSGILQLDFGRSYYYNEPVLGLIGSKMEVSIQFGLIGYFMAWIVCVPLGVFKAIKHRSMFDNLSSVAVFIGYAIPGFVLSLLLLSSLAVHIPWLPLGGYKPDNIEELGWWESVGGRIRHMIIPVAGYLVGSFATMTILMKNSLMENLGQDYIRTGFAKGLSEKRVIFVHALRNSLIPITAGIGHALGLLFAGSFLIEKTCNIDGMGFLGYESILSRDYPVIMGLLVFGVLIQLFGNILSDIIWALIDPRIRFGS
jgi:microcin C transport system permease protein